MTDKSLARLVAAGLLQLKAPDPVRVSAWLTRSQKDVETAGLLERVDRDRAAAVMYEAGYRACAGLLDMAGYRVTSQPGHHRAALDATIELLGAAHRPLLRRLDRARRFRNEALYGIVAPAPAAEFAQLGGDVAWLLERLATELAEARR